jgi:hypothetical protein
MYCYIWSFVVRPEYVDEFKRVYGSEGDWARLFRRDPQYFGTYLVCDRRNLARFLTIDFWSSYEACASFRERLLSEYEELDRRFERLTLEEARVGDFDVLGEWQPGLLKK